MSARSFTKREQTYPEADGWNQKARPDPISTTLLAVQSSPIWRHLSLLDRKMYEIIIALSLAQPPGRRLKATVDQVVKAGALTAHKRAYAKSRRRLRAVGLLEWPPGRTGVAPPCRLSERWRNVPEAEIAAKLKAADKPPVRAEIWIALADYYYRHRPSRRSVRARFGSSTNRDGLKAYARDIFEDQIPKVATATRLRNNALNKASFKIGQYLDACGIDEHEAERRLLDAAKRNGSVRDDRGPRKSLATIRKGLRDGRNNPKQPRPKRSGGTT
jgi:hypothetical protein